MKVDVVILAGGDGGVIDPESRFKGLLPIGGKPMVQWVAEAANSAERVAGVAVVVPSAENLGAWADNVDKLVVSDDKAIGNVIAGVKAFRDERPILLITGDIPAVTPEAIDDYIENSFASGADVTYPLVRKEDVLEQYPGSKRTFVKLATGSVTGGNMLFVKPELVEKNADIGERLFDNRKSTIRMARVIGFKFVVKLASGRLKVHEVEEKLGELLGGEGAAVYTSFASIGADVDKPEDVIVAERVLHARSSK